MTVLEDEETTTTSTDETTDDEDKRRSTRRKRPYNVKVRGGDGNFVIGDNPTIIYKQEYKNTLNVAKVLAEFDAFLQNIASFRGPEKDRIEHFVLTELLPDIEHHAMETSSISSDSLEMLARLVSPSLKSPRVAKFGLKLLNKLIFMDIAKDITNAHIVTTEKHLRESIVSGSFREELVYDQRRRLEVYCNVLTTLLIGRACERLSYPYKETDQMELLTCKTEIEKLLKSWPCPRKDRKRFSSEMILELLDRLMSKKRMLKPISRLLNKCNEMLQNFTDEDVDSFLNEVDHMEDGNVDLLIAIKMLHARVIWACHPNAYTLFKSIVSKHPLFSPKWKQSREKKDWHLALLTCQILVDVTFNHHSEDTRTDAAKFLADIRIKKVFKTSRLIDSIVTRHIMKTAFTFDVESRRILLVDRYTDNTEKLPSMTLCKRICKINQSASMEISELTLSEDGSHVLMRGMYNDKPIAVKAVSVTPPARLFTAHDQETTPEERKLQNEEYISRLLNSENNEHVPKFYDAKIDSLPYHMIMEHAQNGDLRSYLLKRRERDPPSYREALEICLGCAKCMEYVHKKKVVHTKLNSGHVLVGQTSQCIKVTGFGCAKHAVDDNEFYHGYRGIRLDDDDESIRWTDAAGLRDQPLFSSESDVYAFGGVMYEIITCGDVPYADKDLWTVRENVLAGRYLTKEKNMKDGYYHLMQRCFSRDISFKQICNELQGLIGSCNEADNRPMDVKKPKKPTAVEHAAENAVCSDDSANFTTDTSEKRKFVIRQANLDENSEHHAMKLKSLDNPFLVKTFGYTRRSDATVINYEHYSGERLSGVLFKRNNFTVDDLIRFCAQICSAVDYLHSKGIVHCNLTLDNIILVNHNHVKLGGLQHTRSLQFCPNENIPVSSALLIKVPQHLHRWHAPEAIQEQVYSKESAVWSLGMLLWAIMNSIEQDVQCHQPLYQYKDHEILTKLKFGSRPRQSSKCPDWLYIVMTQCWLHQTSQRASSLAILECLTSRLPWETCLLQNWLTKHDKDVAENWPNLNICQRSAEEFITLPQEEVMESMTEEFSDEHCYDYQQPRWFKKSFNAVIGSVKSIFGRRSSSSCRSVQQPLITSSPTPGSNQLFLSSTRIPSLTTPRTRPLPSLPSQPDNVGVYDDVSIADGISEVPREQRDDIYDGTYDDTYDCTIKSTKECYYDYDLTLPLNNDVLCTKEEEEEEEEICGDVYDDCSPSASTFDSSKSKTISEDLAEESYSTCDIFCSSSNNRIFDLYESINDPYEDPYDLFDINEHADRLNDPTPEEDEKGEGKEEEEQQQQQEKGNEELPEQEREDEDTGYQPVLTSQESDDVVIGYSPLYQTPQTETTSYPEYCDVAVQHRAEYCDVAIQCPDPNIQDNN